MSPKQIENSVLKNGLKNNNDLLSLYIIRIVGKYYDKGNEYAVAKNRKRENVFPRQVAMYLMTKFTGLSVEKIGAYFNKDHTTVLHSRKSIFNLVDSDKKVRKQIKELESVIRLRSKALSKKIDLNADFYYLDFNDYESFRFTNNRGMILSGFTQEEIKSIIEHIGNLVDNRLHKETGFYILERKKEI